MFIVSGKIDLSGQILGPGDSRFTEPGEIALPKTIQTSWFYWALASVMIKS